MARTVDLRGVQELLERGGQLVEVLPSEEYEELHLPGAVHIALKELDAEHAEQLDRERPVIVYCWDALCDMSPRAATRLEQLGFDVYDYALSKVDWMAHGLPMEGEGKGHEAHARPTTRTCRCARSDGGHCRQCLWRGGAAIGIRFLRRAAPFLPIFSDCDLGSGAPHTEIWRPIRTPARKH